jgi:hypothetical protein
MQKKPPAKPTLPAKVNFLTDEDEGITELPIFVTRAQKQPQKKPTTKTKKEPNDS